MPSPLPRALGPPLDSSVAISRPPRSDAEVLDHLFQRVMRFVGLQVPVDDLLCRVGLAEVADTTRDIGGMGDIAVLGAVLASCEDIARRISRCRATRLVVRRPEQVARLAAAELRGQSCETLLVFVCDPGDRLLAMVRVAEGSSDRVLIPIRETLVGVLKHHGRAFAVAHNHPSGDTTPSPADLESTRQLREAAGLLGLRFLGHVVVADDRWNTVD